MHSWMYIPAALFATAIGAAGQTADVSLKVSTREAYVGEPVAVEITILNAKRHQPPVFPDLPNATVRPGRSGTRQSMNWVNGKMTREVIATYSYTVTPTQVGQIVIPPISFRVNGKRRHTARTTISVVASDTSDLDLVFLELASSRDSIYLGEAIDVTLEIWVRPYRDRNVRMDAQEMLDRINFGTSQLGQFHDAWVGIQEGRQKWQYRDDTRPDAEGIQRSYYVYLLPISEFVPTRTGPLDIGDVRIVVSYPARTGVERDLLGRPRRDIFTGRQSYAITKARPAVAPLGEPQITVKPVPLEGQPPLFNGAVGRYKFSVQAANTNVRVREPIEITLTIIGQGQLDRVAPPPLAHVEALTDGFRVPDDVLAGIVRGNRKKFTLKISAKHPEVTEIPAIPFVYFDPAAERYVTRRSRPIPLQVAPSESISLAQFAETDDGPATGITRLTETAVGIRANYANPDQLLAQRAFAPGWPTAAVLAISPLAFVACALIRRQRDRLRFDHGYLRRRRACPTALAAIRAASQRESHTEAASQVASAVIGYITDRCAAPSGLTGEEAVEKLAECGVAQQRIRSAAALLESCEGAQYAGTNSDEPADLAARAQDCIRDLERERF